MIEFYPIITSIHFRFNKVDTSCEKDILTTKTRHFVGYRKMNDNKTCLHTVG